MPKCAACGDPNASPMVGHKTPLCSLCHMEWEASPEYATMTAQREKFIARRKKEIK